MYDEAKLSVRNYDMLNIFYVNKLLFLLNCNFKLQKKTINSVGRAAVSLVSKAGFTQTNANKGPFLQQFITFYNKG